MKLILPLLAIASFAVGCATQPPVNYYYGHYSQTLYRSKKDSTPATLAKHRQTLEDIIETSKKKSVKVPPGIYCEYGYMLAKEGSAEAGKYFDLEVQTYPESEKFIGFVKSQLNSNSSPTTAAK